MSTSADSEKHLLALDTFVKLVRSTNSVTKDVYSHFLEELTISQFGVLEALFRFGSSSQKGLADKILKSPGNITTIINNLEKGGFVTRVANAKDRRFCTIELTETGRATITRLSPVHADIVLRRMSALSAREQRQLGDLLLTLATAAP